MDTLDKNLFENSFLSEEAKDYLKETAKWSRFLSILGFIALALLFVFAFSMGALISKFSQLPGGENIGMVASQIGTLLTVVYVIMAIIYFFPTYYLFQFSVKMLNALKSTDSTQLTSSFKNLKSMFKFWGVFSIIIIGLYSFLFIIGLISVMAR